MRQPTDTSLELGTVGKWLGAAAAGALLMYLLDPDRGSARRSRGGEKILGMGRQTSQAVGSALHSAGSRLGASALGATVQPAADGASALASAVRPNGSAGQAIGESVARMGHAASDRLGQSVSRIGDSVSQIGQSASQVASRMFGSAAGAAVGSAAGTRGDWAPAVRSSAVMGGGMLSLYGLLRRSPLGWALGLAGLVLLARGATNQPLRSMLRAHPLSQTIDLEKSIWIDAPPEQVYDMWSNYENFPRFMSHVVAVRDLGHRRSHWVVEGPAGSRFEWDAVLTEQSRPHRLAWRSEPGSEIASEGSVQFEPYRGGTLVTVRMSYSPPAGAIGHGIATLLGADPKRQMDDDLARMKAFIEHGDLPHVARQGKSLSRFLH
jgi:uncharacterized membrane protein